MKRCAARCACVEGHKGPHSIIADTIAAALWPKQFVSISKRQPVNRSRTFIARLQDNTMWLKNASRLGALARKE